MRFERQIQREDRRLNMTTTTRVSSSKSRRIVLLLLAVNAVLWAIFWVGFFSNSVAYPKMQTPGEGAYVTDVVSHRAISPERPLDLQMFYRASFIPNLPSFLVTRVLFNIPTHRNRPPDLYLGTTVAGYELLCWMIFSFLQWYLIGRAVVWFANRKKNFADGVRRSAL
jgi:hypothetical protein